MEVELDGIDEIRRDVYDAHNYDSEINEEDYDSEENKVKEEGEEEGKEQEEVEEEGKEEEEGKKVESKEKRRKAALTEAYEKKKKRCEGHFINFRVLATQYLTNSPYFF